VAFDASFGGDPRRAVCKSCRQPITPQRPAVHVSFDAHAELSGPYHDDPCARPMRAWARLLNESSGR
jgi:hypothetical protein